MDGDARGIGEGIEESRRGSLILSRGSSPARGVRRRPASCSDGVGGTENLPGMGRGLASLSGPRPNGRPGALFSLSPLLFLFNFFSIFPAAFASSF